MTFLDLILVLISTFGILVFGSLTVLWIQDRRRTSDPACRVLSGAAGSRADAHWANGFIAFYTTVWFMVNAGTAFASILSASVIEKLNISMWAMTFLYPPLIMHIHYVAYVSVRPRGEFDARWKWTMWFSYLAGSLTCSFLILKYLVLGGITESFGRWVVLNMIVLFVVTAVYCILINRKTRKPTETAEEKTIRAWHLLLWVLVFLSFPLLMFGGRGILYEVLSILTRSFPLLFVFVGLFLAARFTFFDVFVKRGLFALLVLLCLVGYFFGVSSLPLTDNLTRVWLYALTSLPVALALPWAYRQLEAWLDRAWLGRRFTPESAVEYFLSGLQSATSETELLSHAESRLAAVFQASTEILLPGGRSRQKFIPRVEVPLHSEGERNGTVRMGSRENNMPFFSADIALLTSLSAVLSHLLENVRLQTKKQQQEQRQKELEVHASRSELKALRAQINPHFLFNALNAIAGLIHGSPDRAEETVEQLAEVFRYTLRGSEKEWASLADEMDFVRAYLDVEKARYGDRLETAIEMEDSVRAVRFPVMMVQTLVENAVKHGVASLRGVGRIQVRARRNDQYVSVEVIDNGPGLTESEDSQAKAGSRYGLRNIRERLSGYFGDAAGLSLARDEIAGLTIASIRIPDGEEAQNGGDSWSGC